MNASAAPASIIFLAVCFVLFLIAKGAGYKGDSYEFRMKALLIFVVVCVVLGLLIAIAGQRSAP